MITATILMDKLVLLMFICMVYLCDVGHTQYNSNGLAISDSEELENHSGNAPSCGHIRSSAELEIWKFKTGDRRYSKNTEFPWMAAVYGVINNRSCESWDPDLVKRCWYGICGGLLIGPKVVLVAGGCVYDRKVYKLKVRAGDWNRDTLVTKIIIHPEYRYARKDREIRYDAALLVTQSAFTPAENVAFICLPPLNLNITLISCKVAVWCGRRVGHDRRFTPSGYQPHLKMINLNYLDHAECRRHLWDDYDLGIVLHDSYICTSGKINRFKRWEKINGGSPLMCIAEDHYYARGLLSWTMQSSLIPMTHDNSLPGTMNIFTDVVKVRSWIDQEMRANGFNTDTYTPVAYRERTATK